MQKGVLDMLAVLEPEQVDSRGIAWVKQEIKRLYALGALLTLKLNGQNSGPTSRGLGMSGTIRTISRRYAMNLVNIQHIRSRRAPDALPTHVSLYDVAFSSSDDESNPDEGSSVVTLSLSYMIPHWLMTNTT